jgi:hypothetical protein
MFYGKDMVAKDFDLLINKLLEQELFLFEPMPSYKTGEKWTDEFRIRDGHTKLADGTWVTIIKVTTWVEKLKKDTEDLYTSYQTNLKEIQLLKQQKREMEYGLRVAAKSLNNSLKLTQDFTNNELQ